MSLSTHLIMLPQWLTIFLLVAVAVSFSIAGFLAVHRYIPVRVRQIHNDVAGFVFATLGVTYGALLAFVVIVVWEQFNDAKVISENESSATLILYHNIVAYTDQSASDVMLTALTQYIRLTVEETKGHVFVWQTSDNATVAMDQLFVLVDSVVPDSEHSQILYTQILQNLGELTKYRNLRLQATGEELPSVIWIGIIGGGIIIIGFTFLFGTENVWAHIIIISLLATLIALVIYVVIELDHPSLGPVNIGSSQGYSRILEIVEAKQ